ncbi:TauD/TfdA family dioxygenase [Kribbella sp. NPDC020789]
MDFPYLIEPAGPHEDLPAWLSANAELVDSILSKHGAVLFRNFAVPELDHFYDAAKMLTGELMQYVEGVSPRIAKGGGVYTSTEYSPDVTVAPHNELSYSHQWPGRIAFYCRTPAEQGGETPIVDSRKVYQRLVRKHQALLPRSVRYLRTMHREFGAGVPWPTVFGTDDVDAVSTYCAAAGIKASWDADEALRTEQVRPAAIVHPTTREPVWFNQAHQWHPSNAGEDSEAMLREVFGDDLPMDADLGPDRPLPAELLRIVREAYDDELTVFPWRAGDVMVLDNMLTAHGRMPFTGEREVFVAMGVPVELCTVEEVETYEP